MLTPKQLRQDLPTVIAALKKRGFDFPEQTYQQYETARKTLQTRTQTMQNARNTASKAIGQAKAQGQPIEALLKEVIAKRHYW